MHHVDPDMLALAALGEHALDDDDAAHLARCGECAAELAQTRHVVAVGRQTTPADIPTAPPAAVWERIRDELGLLGVTEPEGANREKTDQGHAGSDASGSGGDAEVLPLRPRPRRMSGWLAMAASAGIVAGGVGGALWASSRPPAPGPDPTVLAEATLDPLPGWDAQGVASVQQVADGARVVVVQVDGEFGTDGYREVWLLAPDLSGMVSLGLLDGSAGEFVLPDGIDLARYSVVDVSEEPFDGDATHSGNSIVRGPVEV